MSTEESRGRLSPALSATLFEAMAQGSRGYVSCVDRQRRLLYVNRTLSRRLDEVIGRPFDSFLAPEHREDAVDAIERAFSSRTIQEVEYTAKLVDGSAVHFRARFVPARGPSGEELALILSEDVTEHWHLAEEIERSVEFRRLVVEHLPDFVTVLDREHRFVWVNRLAPGLTPEDVIGKKLALFESPETLPTMEAAIRAAFESGSVQHYEGKGYGDGTSLAWYLVRVVPVVLDGKVDHALLITSDITERKLAEEALRRTEEHLHQAQRLESLGQLAGGVAHDFNNLLQLITGNLSFAQTSLDQGRSPKEELSQALLATQRAAELTSHLLTIGRRRPVDPRRVDLGALVGDSVRMLRRAIPENISLVYEPPGEPCFVQLDRPQFEQVLINLCVNARDAMPAGGALTIRLQPAGSERVTLSVSDTGGGIAAEYLPRIFEPFFTTKATGSGLGLAVAAGIVNAHAGTITAESDGKSWTTVTVRLPRSSPGASEPLPPPGKTGRKTGIILVAEDEELVRAQTVRILEGAGHVVLQAPDGARAVELFRQRKDDICLVLLDVTMPVLDGWQAYLQIEQLSPKVPVLFTTGYAASALPEDFAVRGARLLSKPYRPAVLLAEIDELLRMTV